MGWLILIRFLFLIKNKIFEWSYRALPSFIKKKQIWIFINAIGKGLWVESTNYNFSVAFLKAAFFPSVTFNIWLNQSETNSSDTNLGVPIYVAARMDLIFTANSLAKALREKWGEWKNENVHKN